MIKIFRKIALEPLFHFIVLGFVLYLYYNVTSSDASAIDKKSIRISSYEIQQMKLDYKKEWQRDITKESLDALIAKKYYEKLLLSEAYSMGLEKQDKSISEKLIKQMQHIMINSSEIVEPTEEQLYQYYKKNIDDYSIIKNLSFSHVYFSNPKDKKIDTMLKLLKIAEVDARNASSFGEEFHESNYIKEFTLEQVKSIYGHYFANKLFDLKQGLWHKAVQSKYGVHLIYITEKKIDEAYPFDEVQSRVYLDYLEEDRRDRESESYKKMNTQYSLEVE